MNTYEIEVGGRPLTIQHGILAQQANGSVTVRQGDTVVLVTAVMADAREGVTSFLEKRSPNYPNKVSTDLPNIWPEWKAPEFR